ncbi:VPA1269 family protein [Microbacteriaceae bacterium K1510]|nr:VPA1269 family protein [Microbacteriaceae bacterium K1510]
MTQNTFIACDKVADAWFNSDPVRFAIVPGTDEDPDKTASVVEGILSACSAASFDGDAVDEALAELIELHARGLVLWPVGFQWGRTALGDVFGQRFARVVEEEDPISFEVREEIFRSSEFQEASWTTSEKRIRSFNFWRYFMTIGFCTTTVRKLADVQESHLLQLYATLKPNGLWLGWVPPYSRNGLWYFVQFLAQQRNKPLLAVSSLNPTRSLVAGSRVGSIVATHPHLEWVDQAFERWADEMPTMTKGGPREAKRLFLDFLRTRPEEETGVRFVFSRSNFKALLEFARTWSTPTNRGLSAAKVLEFAEWFAAQDDLVDIDVGITRYDIDLFLKSLPASTGRPTDVQARPMPTRFHHKLKAIITENDFAWPKSLKHGATGLPVHWMSWHNPATGEVEPIFCEVLPRMLLLHLELPLRNIQVRRLDSGEGDNRYYDAKARKWRGATSPNAGHWDRIGAKNSRRGIFREISSIVGGETITGFWINSNKTQDAGNLFDETSGYEIPWQHDEVLENLAAMRAWQEKYNPVSAPLAHASVPKGIFEEEPSEAVRAVLPSRFYLFRYPLNTGERGREAPPTYKIFHQFFHDALDELERRLTADDPEAAIRIITERDRSGQPRKAIFTIHGMRSSTLTSLHMAGVPIEVLSKVVAGHATILMTLRYTKFDAAHVNDILTKARMQALATERNQFANFLMQATIENAMRMTARISDDGLHQMKGSYQEPTGWSRLELGFCPNGCTQCHTGGDPIVRREAKSTGRDKTTYAPVSGGLRNCVRCRFFVTGLPFLIPLWAHATAILAKVDSLSHRIQSTRKELDDLKRERHTLGTAPTPQPLIDRIRMLDETWVGDTEARDQALADAHATMILVEKVRALFKSANENGDTKLPMLLNDGDLPEITARESTRFELVDAIVQASRWFPSMNTADLERERDEFLNKILYRNGYVPITLSPLSEQERRRAADALAEMLIVELGAAETEAVIDGRKTLADLGLQDKLEVAATNAIGRPIERLLLSAPATAGRTINGSIGAIS